MGITVAVVGLGFGRDFVPLYLRHPQVDRVVLVDADDSRRAAVATEFGIAHRDGPGYGDLAAVFADPTIDAVHVLTPVATHADLVVEALTAGKHVACAVPMATTLDDIDRILRAQELSGTTYMMMETAVYGREFLLVDRLVSAGEFGALTLYRGFHIQNLDGFPAYWQGYPPMHYVTHALSPALALLDSSVESVRCVGAGRLTEARRTGGFDNPFPTEVGLFRMRASDMIADVTMAFFQTARPYGEGFCVYGEHLGFEWAGDDAEEGVLYRMLPPHEGDRGNRVVREPIAENDHGAQLPEELRPFTGIAEVQLDGMPRAVRMEPGHGGSHPYLVHEFISSIVDGRAPRIDARVAAAWTAPGIIAHQSALAGGAELGVPDYSH